MSTTHQFNEEDEWNEIAKSSLFWSCDNMSAWLVKTFANSWEVDPVLLKQTHVLCTSIIQFAPHPLPEDCDHERLSLFAAAELIFLLFSVRRERIGPVESNPMDEAEINIISDYTRILLRQFSKIQKTALVKDIKFLIRTLFSFILLSSPTAEVEALVKNNFSSIFKESLRKPRNSPSDIDKVEAILRNITQEILNFYTIPLIFEAMQQIHGSAVTVRGNETTHVLTKEIPSNIEDSLSTSDIVSLPKCSNSLIARLWENVSSETSIATPPKKFLREKQTSSTVGNETLKTQTPAKTVKKQSMVQQSPRKSRRLESLSPSFSECLVLSPEKKSPNENALATCNTPTNEANPMIRALVRGRTQRLNTTFPRNVDASNKSVNNSIKSLGNNKSSPDVPKPLPLKERIGEPSDESDTDNSTLSDISTDSDSSERKPKKTRKRIPWTIDEYNAVLKGVSRFGEGKWRDIQLHYPALKHRSNIAVKDAWRLISKNPTLLKQ